MRKITIKSDTHDTSVCFFVPEVIEDSFSAMRWVEEESDQEKNNTGRYGPKRKRELDNKRKLCKAFGKDRCGCFVKFEQYEG